MSKQDFDVYVAQIISSSDNVEQVEILLDEFRTRVRGETINEVQQFMNRLK